MHRQTRIKNGVLSLLTDSTSAQVLQHDVDETLHAKYFSRIPPSRRT